VNTRILARHAATLILGACLLVVLGTAVTAQSVGPGPSVSPEPLVDATPAPHPLSGGWDVVAFDAWNEGLVQPRAGASWTAIFLTDGRLEGSTGCGTYFGGYSIDGERLGMGIISKGPDPCDVETTEEAVEYSVALEAVASWRPAYDGAELLDEAGAVRVVLARSGDSGVSGDWVATRYARANGRPAEPLADRPILLTFGDDGNLRGSSGCRLLHGLYSSQADQVVIAPVETTGLPCEGDVRSQERRLLRIFEQVVFWQRQGERLILADASGAPLLELDEVEEATEAVPSELPAESGG
jgi:heat shock protein HslJ